MIGRYLFGLQPLSSLLKLHIIGYAKGPPLRIIYWLSQKVALYYPSTYMLWTIMDGCVFHIQADAPSTRWQLARAMVVASLLLSSTTAVVDVPHYSPPYPQILQRGMLVIDW